MNEIYFNLWLNKNGYSKKMQSDIVSRIKKIERSNNYSDVEEEYEQNKLDYLFSLFDNKGLNDNMAKLYYNELPVGKYQLSTYKYALSLYLKYIQARVEAGN